MSEELGLKFISGINVYLKVLGVICFEEIVKRQYTVVNLSKGKDGHIC